MTVYVLLLTDPSMTDVLGVYDDQARAELAARLTMAQQALAEEWVREDGAAGVQRWVAAIGGSILELIPLPLNADPRILPLLHRP